MKICLGLVEISGYCERLRQGFQRIGIPCDLICFNEHLFQYGKEDKRFLLLLIHFFARKCKDAPGWLQKRWWLGLRETTKIFLFLWALFRYDVFILGYGVSFFLNNFDLKIMKLFNKTIVCVFYGSDSRPPYLDGGSIGSENNMTVDQCIILSKSKKTKICFIEKYADVIVGHPPMCHFNEQPFVLGLFMGIPCEHPAVPDYGCGDRDKVRILHSPSSPELKGTVQIRKAIANLILKGHAIEYIEISSRPNSIVLEELNRCDFVVDQLYSDTPMAAFAAEAATFGKPAVVGGYYFEMLQADYPAKCIPPSLYCHPDNIEESIEKMITDKAFRKELSGNAKAFVEKHWKPEHVANRFFQLITREIPKEWMYDPSKIRYILGAGVSEAQVRKWVKRIIQAGGTSALQLDDKPQLQKMLLQFAQSSNESAG